MSDLSSVPPDDSSKPGSGQPANRPRIRDLEEMERKRIRDGQRYEFRAKLFRVLLLLLCIAGAAVLVVGWADLYPRIERVEGGLVYLRSLTASDVELCRRHTGDDPAAKSLLSKLFEAENQMSSGDLPNRVRGYREYRVFARVLCSVVGDLVKKKRRSLYTGMVRHLGETETEVKVAVRQFNLHSKDYNLAVQRFPGSTVRPLVGFPDQLPYLSD